MPSPQTAKLIQVGSYSLIGVQDVNGNIALGTTPFYQTSSGLLVPAPTDANGVPLTSLSGSSAHFSEETNATTTDTPYTANVKQQITFVNDGSANIQINFDSPVGSAGTMTIKPGEALNNFPRAFTTLHVQSASGTQAFRAWGV